MGKVYYVGEKASFVNDRKSYQPGDEINGDIFNPKDLEKLLKSGKLTTTPPPDAKPSAPAGNGKKTLDEMTVDELKAYAAEKGIEVSGNKKEILAAIKAAEKVKKNPDEMTDDELKAYAAEKGIDASGNREEVLAAIKAAAGD